jgi:hypothetical protein
MKISRKRKAVAIICFVWNDARIPSAVNLVPRVLILTRRRGETLVGAGHVISQYFIALGGVGKVSYYMLPFHFTCFLSGDIGHVRLHRISVLLRICGLTKRCFTNSVNQNIILKAKQVICLENVYLENDVMCVLPTGYGKSLIFHLLPMLLFAKYKLRGDLLLSWRSRGISTAAVESIIIVVSPLNSLMSDQVYRLSMSGIRSAIINVKEAIRDRMIYESDKNVDFESNVEIDFSLCKERKLHDGHYHIVFAHPETLISSKYGRNLLLSEKYQENVLGIVIDEAHCIVEWLVF